MLSPQLSLQRRVADLVLTARRRASFTHSGTDAAAWQSALRSELRDLLKVDVADPQPVAAEIISERDMGDYVRQYVRIRSRDGVTVPAYKLVPKVLSGTVPAVMCLHGHGPGKVVPVGFEQDATGQPVQVVGERDYAVQAVREGYIALSPDLRGMGELVLAEDLDAGRGASCDQLSCRAVMVGRTLLGMRVLDVMSCVDYLLTDDRIDASRLVCTGQSGGGTATLFATAIDTRFAVSIPSCYFCTFQASILAMSHCSCNYAPGLLDLCEMYDVAGLIAPRPMLVIAGAQDPIFPIAGVHEAYAIVERIYEAFAAGENLELYVGPEGHRYYKARVWDFVREH
jgi:dienelactone hydrolase